MTVVAPVRGCCVVRWSRRVESGAGHAAKSLGDLGAALGVAGDQQHGVVAGDGAEHVGQARRGRSPTRAGGRRRVGCAPRRGWRSPRPTRRARPQAATPGLGRVGERAQHRAWRLVADGVDRAAAGPAHLDGAQLLEVARQRRLGDRDALGGEQPTSSVWERTACGGEQRDDPGLAGRLGVRRRADGSPATSRRAITRCLASRNASSAFCACSRFSAWSNTMLAGPSMTAAAISSPRCAGRQCMTTASGAAAATSAARRARTAGTPRAGSLPRPPAPSTPRRRCRARRRRRPPPAGRSSRRRCRRSRAASSAARAVTWSSGSKPAGAPTRTCMPAIAPAEQQRVRHVVAVAEIGQRQPGQRRPCARGSSAGRRAPGTGGRSRSAR